MSKQPAPAWMTKWEYAHRGLHSPCVAENSLAAVRAAIGAGMGIECDIQLTRDNDPIVFHDWELDRLTDHSGRVGQSSRTALGSVKLKLDGQPIPSLADFLHCVGGKVPLLIELKSKPEYDVERSCQSVMRELEAYSGKFAVMSFDPRVAPWFRENAPSVAAGLVMREDEHGFTQSHKARVDCVAKANPDFLAYHVAALPNPWVKSLRQKGFQVLTWTVNTPTARSIALEYADGLISEGAGLA